MWKRLLQTKMLLLVIIMLMSDMVVHAQPSATGSIRGQVLDSQTGEEVIGANVFINNTTIGAATDIEGRYRINQVKPGNYELVFSHVTYNYKVVNITVVPGQELEVEMTMDANVRELSEITIKGGNNREWKRSLGFFEEYFLGTSFNANKCTIRNPEVLDFQYDPDTKVTNVVADAELIIDNEALGYTIYYVLDQFAFDQDYKIMLGKNRFQEMEAPDEKTLRKWEKNRSRSYYGSPQHFFSTLVKGTLQENDFKIYRLDNLPQTGKEPRYQVTPDQMLSFAVLDKKRKLFFPGFLEIVYDGEPEPAAYQNYINASKSDERSLSAQADSGGSAQRSVISLEGKALQIDDQGYVYNPTDYVVYGYWAWERIAEVMPLDYEPQ